ncbi:NPL4 family-domain-containing protein [Lipomyces japonicus]|uniref:NPL4 family-domain-containing protein n=1 Tax=Lipomyces japonicus TaxID=56871 RepID=UPI0034CECFFC
MIIRFRTKDGMFRAQAESNQSFEILSQQLISQLPDHIDPLSVTVNDQPVGKGKPVTELARLSLSDLRLKHGDLLFVSYENASAADPTSTTTTITTTERQSAPAAIRLNGKAISEAELVQANVKTNSFSGPNNHDASIVQDPVDNELDNQDGKISRNRDTKMCQHSEKGMCDYCMPLEPWDPAYLAGQGIKFESFHAHVRKLNQASTNSGGSVVPPLTPADFKVRPDCPSGHAAWPLGICSKCLPSAITLQPQPFRMVDHVEFASSDVVDRFIDNWRRTGNQSIAYLYGRYESYANVPLGIKAVVHAVHEPPQITYVDGVQLLLPWQEESQVDADMASRGQQQQQQQQGRSTGWQKLGVIFTDLQDAGQNNGTVVCKRHADSYFLSSLEITFAAELQKRHGNPTRASTSGQFSSKFVTCVVSGNAQGQIEISAYQVSNTAEAMVDADIVQASVSPELMLVKQPSDKRYVPDVFFRRVNEYNVAVQENAKPVFPVEYLLVTLTHGFRTGT